jgi:hypothetical protein
MRGTRGRRSRLRFDGWIAGVGTSSGTRVVLGHWQRSPFGPFSDVMIERADGERLLLAPSHRTADFVRGTYSFDLVRVVPVDVTVADDTWTVTAGPLVLRFTVGRRRPAGVLLRAVPGVLAARPAWAALTNGPAHLLPTHVRTRGRTGATPRVVRRTGHAAGRRGVRGLRGPRPRGHGAGRTARALRVRFGAPETHPHTGHDDGGTGPA